MSHGFAVNWSGTSGFSGQSGYSGVSGYSGYTGQSGLSGTSGYSGQAGHAQNLLINGGMFVAQRQPGTETTLTSYSDDAYCTADRFYVLTQTAAIQTALATGDVCTNSLQLKQNQGSAQRMGVAQIVESRNCLPMQGKAMRFQGRFKISNDQDVRYAIIEWTGTADAVTSDWVLDWTSSTYTANNFFTNTGTTVTAVGESALPGTGWVDFSLDGSISSSATNIAVIIWTEGTAAQNVTLDVEALDLHLVQASRDFDPRLEEEELALCQRYYQRFGGLASDERIMAGWVATSNVATLVMAFPVQMRAAPTFANSTVSDFRIFYGSNAVTDMTAISQVTTSRSSSSFNCTATGTPLTAGEAALLGAQNTNARLTFTAEL